MGLSEELSRCSPILPHLFGPGDDPCPQTSRRQTFGDDFVEVIQRPNPVLERSRTAESGRVLMRNHPILPGCVAKHFSGRWARHQTNHGFIGREEVVGGPLSAGNELSLPVAVKEAVVITRL